MTIKNASRLLLATGLLLLCVPAIFAQAEMMDINVPPGSHPTGTLYPRTGICSLTGGFVYENAFWPRIIGHQYINTGFYPAGCYTCNPIAINFDEPVNSVRFFMWNTGANSEWINGQLIDGRAFEIFDDLGHSQTRFFNFQVAYWMDWPYDGVKKITIRSYINYHYYGIDAITWIRKPGVAIQVRLGEDPNAPSPPEPVRVTSSTKVRIPLGRTFSIRAKAIGSNGAWRDVPSTFSLSSTRVFNDGPPHPEQTLYPDYPMFIYSTPPDAATRFVQSLRLGDGVVTITPNDHAIEPVSFTVESAPPARLGATTTNNPVAWDGTIWEQAHQRGIPPQYIKAIADHESGWNINAWRYEPGADKNYVAPRRRLAAYPHNDYVLPAPNWDDGGMSMGRWLCPSSVNPGCGFAIDDLSPKSPLSFRRGNAVQPIPALNVNANITIREICDGNLRQGWHNPQAPVCPPAPPPPVPALGTLSFLRVGAQRTRPVGHPDPWRIIANPHLASSYGLMQSTWYSVIENKIWEGSTPAGANFLRLNPALLFDTSNNIARGSASLIVGPNELRYQFVFRNFGRDTQRAVNPSYGTVDAFKAHMRAAVIGYNGGGVGAIDYADNRVLPLVPKYEAVFANNTPIVTTSGGGGAACSGVPTVTSQTSVVAIEPGGSATLAVTSPDADTIRWYRGMVGDLSNPIATNPWIIVTPASTTSYWARLSNDCGDTSVPATVTVGPGCTSASVSAISADLTVVRGTLVPITVSINGTATSYQWYSTLDDGNTQTLLSGATGPTLQVTPQVTTAYYVVITCECGTIASSLVHVTVTPCTAPAITTNPSGSAITAGAQATLTVAASGTAPLSVQWKTAAGAVAGSGLGIQVQPAQTTSYYAVVSNTCGSATSAQATVTVCNPASIVVQPVGSNVPPGQTASLSVTANGTAPLAYQWSANGMAISGATGSTLMPTITATTSYTVTVTNSCGSVTSVPATVTACSTPAITAQPQNAALIAGQSTTLSVTATGTPLAYQWSKDGTAIAGATAASLPITPPATAGYTVTLSNACGTVTSTTATVSVCNPASITTQPQSATVTAGQSRTLSVVAAGTGTLTYQWSAGGTAIGGATGSSLTVTPASTTSYTITVTNGCGSVTSAAATVTVCTPPAITAQPQNLSLTAGQTGTLSVTATGSSPGYQWFQNGVAITGATASVLTGPATATASYYVVVSNACGTVTSATATVTVCNPAAITGQPQSATITAGQSNTLSVTATDSGTLTYQWSAGGTAIAGATTSSLTISPSTTTSYTVTVSNSCGTVTSVPATVTVCSPPAITTQPQSATITDGQSRTLTVTATGSATLAYQWTANGTAIAGATASSLTVTPSATTGYTVTVTNSCGSVTSTTATLTVCTVPFITTQPLNKTINSGQSTTLTVGAGGSAPLSYQWYANNVAIAAATSYTVSVSPATTTSYTVTVTNACGSVTSAVRTVTVCVPPSITRQPTNVTVNAGQSTTLETLASGTANLYYQWYTSSSTILTGQTSRFLTVSPSQTTSYYCVVTNGCGTATSNTAQVTIYVCEPPVVRQQPVNATITAGQSATITGLVLGSSPMSFQWYENGVAMPGRTAASTTVTPMVTTQYFIRFTNPCGMAQSDTITITVVP
jgi:hypothetical protein